MDCGFGGANNGCNGAGFESYLSWLVAKKQNLASEAGYPYTSGTSGTHGTCRSYKKFNQGFTSSSSTFSFFSIIFIRRCPHHRGTLDLEGRRNPPEEAGGAARRRDRHRGGPRRLHALQRRNLPGLHQQEHQPRRGGGGLRHGEWCRLLAYQGIRIYFTFSLVFVI